MENLWRDLRYGGRSLARNPGCTTAAVITLGLGIGATTALFSVVNAVLLQPLPYKNSDQLVRIVERAAPRTAGSPLLRRTGMRWPEMIEWRTGTTTLSDRLKPDPTYDDLRLWERQSKSRDTLGALHQRRSISELYESRSAWPARIRDRRS